MDELIGQSSPPSSTTAATNSTVSWRSAFWGVMAFVINTAVQDAGSVLGMDRRHRIHLKFSPAVCLFDSIDILVQVVTYMEEYGLQGAIRQVAFQRGERTAAEPEAQSGASKTIHWITFLGMLSQCLKLFSCEGILRTQALAAVYLFAYLVQGMLNQFGHTGTCSTTDLFARKQLLKLRRSSRALCRGFVVFAQVSICICAYTLPLSFDDKGENFFTNYNYDLVAELSISLQHFSISTLLSVITLAHLLGIFAACSGNWRRSPRFLDIHTTLKDPSVGTLNQLAALVTSYVMVYVFNMYINFMTILGSGLDYERRQIFETELQRNSLRVLVARAVAAFYWAQQAVSVCVVSISMASFLFIAGRQPPSFQRGRFLQHISFLTNPSLWMTLLSLVNLLSGLFAYAFAYDQRGTSKPPWTENLG